MKRFGLVLLATVGLASLVQAADLPTGKEAASAPKPNCWASIWAWLNTSASDCPIGAYGITLFGNLDLAGAYLSNGNGLGYSPSADKVNYGIQKNAYSGRWIAAYNGLTNSVIGLEMDEDLARIGLSGWTLIGVLEAGVNPYSGMLTNGPRTLADNNFRPAGMWPWQTVNFDSSRAGQWNNSQGFIGVSHASFGTLTFGRTRSLALDVTSAYDPLASNAFSLLGFSSAFPGFGDTETVRPNTAFTYRLTYQNFRAAGQVQIGGYGWGNASQGMYQGQIGADFGPLSLDGVISYTKDAVSLSSFGGSNFYCVKGTTNCFININNAYFDPNSVLKATLSNNNGLELVAKYKWNMVTFYGGYLYANLQNPSDSNLAGFPTLAEGHLRSGRLLEQGRLYERRGQQQQLQLPSRAQHRLDWLQVVRVEQSRRRDGDLLSEPEQLQLHRGPIWLHDPRRLHGRRRLHQQQQVRRQPGRGLVPRRLPSGEARRPLRGRDGHQRLRRPRLRVLFDSFGLQSRREDDVHRQHGPHAGMGSDNRHPRQLLTARERRVDCHGRRKRQRPAGRRSRGSAVSLKPRPSPRIAADASLVAIVEVAA